MTWQPHERAFVPAVQCLAFDGYAELLWTGGATGHVSSHFTGKEYSFSRYTAYRAHIPGPVQEISADERGILSVGGSVKLASRRGVAAWNTYNEGNNLNTACYSKPSSTEIVAGGTNIFGGSQPDLLCINAGSGTILRRVPSPAPIACVRRSNLVACGQADGRIVLRDPRSLKAEQTITAHTNGLSALEVQGNCILSIGYTIRQGVPVVDPLVKVFDVRARRPLPPISFPSIPAFVKPHPRNNSMVFVASAQGHFQLADLSNPASIEFYTTETNSYLTAMTVAPTGQGLAFADADGIVDIWSAAPPDEEPVFARFANPVEMPAPPEPPKHVNWTPDTPLNVIGMPYYDSQLFSYLPLSLYSSPYSPFGQPPKPIDPAVLATMKTVDFVGYAVNPKITKRNQALPHGTKAREASRKMDVPQFRSEKEREATAKRKARGESETAVNHLPEDAQADKRQKMPKHYRKVEIKYSKFGVEDFDFGFYNKTKYSGLETHIVNSYTNALMQALRFIRPIRELAEGHIWTPCPRENCLLCEAGFLFKMLRDAKGVNCQASNFSKAFSSSQQANALGLMDIDDTASQVAYSSLIQICNRFLLETMNSESDRGPDNPKVLKIESPLYTHALPPSLSQIMGLAVRTTSTCSHCGYRNSRESTTNVLDMVYPRKALSNEIQPQTTFPAIFKASIAREAMTKVSCAGCRQLTSARVRRELTGAPLPPVLAVNTAVHTPDHVEIWLDKPSRTGITTHRFLQPAIAISPSGDHIVPLAKHSMTEPDHVTYELRAMVVQIQAEDDPAHLVSLVKVDRAITADSQWHLFNDFLVKPVTEEEALSFAGSWKIPAILYYQRSDVNKVLDFSALEVPPDESILTADVSTARHRKPSMIKHKPLQRDELPHQGTLVSIDAEFVSLQQEEVEYRSDGTKSLIRPSRMALARVSVLRGEGPSTGIPFIDDHIQVNEPIIDYLTEFSGIRPGDLDVKTSPHTLVPSKVAYKKLRLLVDLGCTFIGHGLNKDFRIINIFVPPSRILDTVNIYHLAHRHRKLSLRFLSWVVLHQDIQSSGSHDSIEDARTALQLYEKHCQLEAEGNWENTLEEIYREGGKLNWKVPGSDVSPVPTQRTQLHTSRQPHQGTLSAHLNRLHV